VRGGRQSTVHWHAFRRYRSRLAGQYDVVIDQINTIPFLTPLWSDIPVVMFIHQLAREVWWYESMFPVSAVGYLVEPLYLRLYRKVPVVTVSQSTAADLRKLGFKSSITVIPEGVGLIPSLSATKQTDPHFLYVGRLAPSKRIDHILQAMTLFLKARGTGILWLAGSGSDGYQRSLVKLARRLGIEDRVVFWGHVADAEKYRLMTEAHALLMTSVREGWGLVVTEANACGTPAVVYDVPGLRDSVRDGLTGLIVPPLPAQLADAMIRLTTDSRLYAALSSEARRWSRTLSFDEASRKFGEVLEDVTKPSRAVA
jgi:glycosyltransferase involved in cell wall biosynthesis